MSELKFFKPGTVEEASRLLTNPGYLAIAGGTDLIVKIRNGLYPGAVAIVDITALPFKAVVKEKDRVIIGSGCTMSQVIADPVINEFFPTLIRAASTVGAMQIRNAATIGGNTANASPAGDTIPALYSLEAEVLVTGPHGRKSLPIEKFFTGPGRSVLQPGELIEGFALPLRKTTGSFLKLGERRAHAISKINLALTTWHDGKPRYRIAIGSAAPTVLRCEKAEAILEAAGHPLSEAVLMQVAAIASETAQPISDVRSTRTYRKQMAGVLLKRALQSLA